MLHGEEYNMIDHIYVIRKTEKQLNIQCLKCKKEKQTFNFEFTFKDGTKNDPKEITSKRIFHGLHYEKYHELVGNIIYNSDDDSHSDQI